MSKFIVCCFISKPGVEECNDSFLRDYEPLEIIGKGNFSEVIKCKKRENGQIFACKRMKRAFKNWKHTRETYAAEVLPHNKNILQLLDVHFDVLSGRLSLVYDIMDSDLFTIIRGERKNEMLLKGDGRVCSIIFQILSAVAHLHAHRIFHCDIKPENILLKLPEYLVKLADFGNVQPIDEALPHLQQYAVSRWYRPPECILTFGYYGREIDIWAAGCIFYELLTRQVLFRGQSELHQISLIHEIIGPPPKQVILNFCNCADLERGYHGPDTPTYQRFKDMDKLLRELKSSHEKLANCGPSRATEHENCLWTHMIPHVVTDDAKALLLLLLQYDPKLRPTAEGALMHFYFKAYRENIVYGSRV